MNTTLSISEYISVYAKRIEAELLKAIPSAWDIPAKLRESIEYSLMAGGKRLRPILVLAAAEALGSSMESAMPVACAIEMIHTYSLIHDDLPSMDNDDYRRGKLTNHKVYGDAMAVLAGDALLTHAFYCITQAFKTSHVPAEQVLGIIEELSVFAGAKGMVGGQAADMLGEQGITSLAELEYIHLHKTSDLIVFSLRAGGRVANATDKQLSALEKFGNRIGLAFQIQDDILDIIGDEQKLGKQVNSDLKLQKVTYPYFLGMEKCRQRVRELTKEAIEAVAADIPNSERLWQIADYLMKRDH